MTPKQRVLSKLPKAGLDYYEFLRKHGNPCWYVRGVMPQGSAISPISRTPREAWASADSAIGSDYTTMLLDKKNLIWCSGCWRKIQARQPKWKLMEKP